MEGSLLFDLRAAGLPPAVEAELLLFSFGQRIGLQSHRGNSYARLSYEFATGNWISPAWLPDGPEEWEGVNQLRAADYPSAVKSCDLRGSEM
jgi:hypothetical protein